MKDENAAKNTGKACPGLDPGMPALPAFSYSDSQKQSEKEKDMVATGILPVILDRGPFNGCPTTLHHDPISIANEHKNFREALWEPPGLRSHNES